MLLSLSFENNFSRQIQLFRVLKDKKRCNEGPSNGDPLSRGGHGHQSISPIDHQKYAYFYTLVKSRIFDMIKGV